MKNSLIFLLLFLFSAQIIAESKTSDKASKKVYESTRQYTFSWLFQDESRMRIEMHRNDNEHNDENGMNWK